MDPGRRRPARVTRRRLRGIRHVLRRCARLCLAGMAGLAGPVPSDMDDLASSILEPPCPPPGHPERAVPQVPPSPVERELWADLLGYSRRD